MQYLNDDMDELYRRAAEDYPLNTNSADWNAVLKKIYVDGTGTIGNEKESRNYRWLLLLLLLLPAAWIGKEYFYSSNKQVGNNSLTQNVSKNKLASPGLKLLVPETLEPATINTVPDNSREQMRSNTEADTHNRKQFFKPGHLTVTINAPEISEQSSSPREDQINEAEQKVTADNDIVKNDKTNITTTTDVTTTHVPADGNKENNKPVSKKNKGQKQKEHGVYAGIIISPEVSTVKFQPVKNIGFTAGVLIGYQFNKNISIESGAAWNKKYYNSNGEYFSTKKITLPTYAKIKKLDGTCKMIEVPVTVKYNFRSSAKTALSVSGGMSSYIMKKENYNYTVERNGQQYPRKAAYKNSSTDLFAVASVGFGYNRSLGKGSVLRLEPYIKIPVKGVGIGSLPIMSSGMNIAITKKLFK
jgi:hypothetical protein